MWVEFNVRRLASMGVGVLGMFAAFLFGYWAWSIGTIFWLTIFLSVFSLLFLTMGTLVLFGYSAISVDTNTKEWREYISFFDLQLFVKSEPLPIQLDYILIFEAIYKPRPINTPYRQYEGTDLYEVSVVYSDNKKKLFKLTVFKNKAIKTAEELQKIFNVEILDKTRD